MHFAVADDAAHRGGEHTQVPPCCRRDGNQKAVVVKYLHKQRHAVRDTAHVGLGENGYNRDSKAGNLLVKPRPSTHQVAVTLSLLPYARLQGDGGAI